MGHVFGDAERREDAETRGGRPGKEGIPVTEKLPQDAADEGHDDGRDVVHGHPHAQRLREFVPRGDPVGVGRQGHRQDERVQDAIREARHHCLQMIILGSFPRAREVL